MMSTLRGTKPVIAFEGSDGVSTISNKNTSVDGIIGPFKTETDKLNDYECESILQGDVQGALQSLSARSNRDPNGISLVMVVVQEERIDLLKSLTKYIVGQNVRHFPYSLDVNATDINGATSLIFCAHKGHVDMVTELVNFGADIEVANSQGYTAVMAAIQQGHVEVVETLMELKANLTQKTNTGKTALLLACMTTKRLRGSDKARVLKVLLESGCSVDDSDDEGDTALILAARSKSKDLVKILLEKGAMIDKQNKHGQTALMEAVIGRRVDIVELLLQRKASPELTSKSGISAMAIVLVNGNSDLIECFQKNAVIPNDCIKIFVAITLGILSAVMKSEVESQNPAGLFPLMVASAQGSIKMIMKIISFLPDVNAITRDGMTAIGCALAHGKTKVADLLRGYNADINLKDTKGQTLLHRYAAAGNFEAVQRLERFGANLEITDRDDKTPLMTAVENGHHDIATYLKTMKVKDVTGVNSLSAVLFQAFTQKNVVLIEYCIKNNVNIHIRNKDGCTPLILASQLGYIKFVKLFLERNANLNIVDNNGQTALMHASRKGHRYIVKQLIEHSALIHIKDTRGMQAVNFARRKGHSDIVKLLQSEMPEESDLKVCCYALSDNRLTTIRPNQPIHACKLKNCKMLDRLLATEKWLPDQISEAVCYCAENNLQLLLCTFQDNGVNPLCVLLQSAQGTRVVAKWMRHSFSFSSMSQSQKADVVRLLLQEGEFKLCHMIMKKFQLQVKDYLDDGLICLGNPDVVPTNLQVLACNTALDRPLKDDNRPKPARANQLTEACVLGDFTKLNTLLTNKRWSTGEISQAVCFCAVNNLQLLLCTLRNNHIDPLCVMLQSEQGCRAVVEMMKSSFFDNDNMGLDEDNPINDGLLTQVRVSAYNTASDEE